MTNRRCSLGHMPRYRALQAEPARPALIRAWRPGPGGAMCALLPAARAFDQTEVPVGSSAALAGNRGRIGPGQDRHAPGADDEMSRRNRRPTSAAEATAAVRLRWPKPPNSVPGTHDRNRVIRCRLPLRDDHSIAVGPDETQYHLSPNFHAARAPIHTPSTAGDDVATGGHPSRVPPPRRLTDAAACRPGHPPEIA